MRRVKAVRQVEDVHGLQLRPVDVGDGTGRRRPPVDHELVRVVEQLPRDRDGLDPGLEVERLRNAVGVGVARVVRKRQLEVPLCELVRVLR